MSRNWRGTAIFIALASLVGFGLGVIGVPSFERLVISITFASVGSMIAVNLGGNRKALKVTGTEKEVLLATAPPAGKAVLLIYREGFVGMAVGIDVSGRADRRPVA